MKITILSMFPEMLEILYKAPIIDHAIQKNLVEIEIIDIRDYAKGSYRHIDDSPYGGGTGMLIRYDVLHDALSSVRKENSHVILPIPAGKPYVQNDAKRYREKDHLILIAGHYEGVDARIYEECDELVSLGDYIVSGGEYACMMICDSVVRLLDGVIKKESIQNESFENGVLEYPQYTRPFEYNGKKVPDILLSGNHEAIQSFNQKESIEWTKRYRKDLLEKKK